MATAVHDINVPAATGVESREPHDVGELIVKLCAKLNEGDPAPSFEVKTLDGRAIRLQDLRGKIVLLTFWASWCEASVAEIPTLRAIYEECGKDQRFAMIGLSLDKSSEVLRQFVQQREINWTQVHLGDWSQTALPSQYAVTYIPALFLIGPDGTVLRQNLRGSQVRDEVGKALAALQ